jgi:hypothetical protein
MLPAFLAIAINDPRGSLTGPYELKDLVANHS